MSELDRYNVNLARQQTATAAWQFNDPHFKYLLDLLSRGLYGGSTASVTPDTRRALSHVLALTQNHNPEFFGNPFKEYAETHRAILEQTSRSGLNVAVYGAGTDPGTFADPVRSKSYGTGNLTLTTATLMSQAFSDSMRNEAGQLEKYKTHGLSARVLNQMLPHIISKMDISNATQLREGLGKATTVESLGKAIKEMEKTADESSLKDIKKVHKAMKYLSTEVGGSITEYSSENESKIKANLKAGGYDDTVIQQTLMQMKGKNTAFTTLSKDFRDTSKKILDGTAENLKDLMTIFDTDSVNEVVRYAKGMGISNIFTDNKEQIASIRKEIRGLAAMSVETGRGMQELAAERVQIATGLSAMHGGRVVESSLVSGVQEAMNSASAQPGGMYTREEAGAAAVRSIANTQNIYQGAILARGIMTDLKAAGGMDAKLEAKLNGMLQSLKGATSDDAAVINSQIMDVLRSSVGSELVDSAIARQHYNSKHTAEFHEMLGDQMLPDNISTIISNAGFSGKKAKSLKSLALKDFKAFGTRRDISAKFHNLVASGKLDEAREMLQVDASWSKEDADAYIKELTQEEGLLGTYNTTLGQTGLTAEWTKRYSGKSDAERVARSKSFNAGLLNRGTKFGKDTSKADLLSIITGELAKGDLTAETVADWSIRRAALEFSTAETTPSKVIDKLTKMGVDAVSLGKFNTDTNRLELSDNEEERTKQRTALKSKLGIDDAKLDELLQDPGALDDMLRSKGWSIAGAKDSTGGLYAYGEEQAQNTAAKYTKEHGDSFTRAVSSVGGKDAVTMDMVDGAPVMKYKLKGSRGWNTKAELVEWLKSDTGRAELVKLADQGNPEAEKLLSDSIKSSLNKIKDKKAFADLRKQDTNVTLGDLQDAAEKRWHVKNFTALGSGSMQALIREGLVTEGKDGKYTYAKDFKIGKKAFKKNETADASEVQKQARDDDAYKALSGFKLSTLSTQPVTSEQVERAIEYLGSISNMFVSGRAKVTLSIF